jgi:uncharacterized spore protein YtfJ
MSEPEKLFESVAPRLEALAKSNAVVGPITTVGGRHAIPLVELALGLGGAGGSGEGDDPATGGHGKGIGGVAGGSAKATPVAVIVVDNGKVSIQGLGA